MRSTQMLLVVTLLVLLTAVGCENITQSNDEHKMASLVRTVPLKDELVLAWPKIQTGSPDSSVASQFVGQSVDLETKQVLTSPFTFKPTAYQFSASPTPIGTTVTLLRDDSEWGYYIPEVPHVLSSGEFDIAVKTTIPLGTFSVLPDSLNETARSSTDASEFYYLYGSQFVSESEVSIYLTYVFRYRVLPESIPDSAAVQKSVYDAVLRMLTSKNQIQLTESVLAKLDAHGTYGQSIYTNMYDPTWTAPSSLPSTGIVFQESVKSIVDTFQTTNDWSWLSGDRKFKSYLSLEIFANQMPEISAGLATILSNMPNKATWVASWVGLRNSMQQILEQSASADLRALALAARNACDSEVSGINQNALTARAPSPEEFSEVLAAWKSEASLGTKAN